MTSGAASKSLFENGRRANEPGAKLGFNNGAVENSPRAEHAGTPMASSLGKNAGSVGGKIGRTYRGLNAGNLLGTHPQNSSGLAKLSANDVTDAVQAIVLHFPIKEAARLQDNTTKAVERQRAGDNSMSLEAAANMCRGSARARALFAPLFGFTGDCTDPDFMEAQELLAKSYLRRQVELYGGAHEVLAADNSEDEGEAFDRLTPDLFEGMH